MTTTQRDWKLIEDALSRHYDFFIAGLAYPRETEFKEAVMGDIKTIFSSLLAEIAGEAGKLEERWSEDYYDAAVSKDEVLDLIRSHIEGK